MVRLKPVIIQLFCMSGNAARAGDHQRARRSYLPARVTGRQKTGSRLCHAFDCCIAMTLRRARNSMDGTSQSCLRESRVRIARRSILPKPLHWQQRLARLDGQRIQAVCVWWGRRGEQTRGIEADTGRIAKGHLASPQAHSWANSRSSARPLPHHTLMDTQQENEMNKFENIPTDQSRQQGQQRLGRNAWKAVSRRRRRNWKDRLFDARSWLEVANHSLPRIPTAPKTTTPARLF